MTIDFSKLDHYGLKALAAARIGDLRNGARASGTALQWKAKSLVILAYDEAEKKAIKLRIQEIEQNRAYDVPEVGWHYDRQAGGLVLERNLPEILKALAAASKKDVWVGKAPKPETPVALKNPDVATRGTADVFLLKLREPGRLEKQLRTLRAFTRRQAPGGEATPYPEMYLWGLSAAKDGDPLFLIGHKRKVDTDGMKLLRGARADAGDVKHIRARVQLKDNVLNLLPVRGDWKTCLPPLRMALRGRVKAVRIAPGQFQPLSEAELDAMPEGLDVFTNAELADEAGVVFELDRGESPVTEEALFAAIDPGEKQAKANEDLAREEAHAALNALLEGEVAAIRKALGDVSTEALLLQALTAARRQDPFIDDRILDLRAEIEAVDGELARVGVGKKDRMLLWRDVPAPLRSAKLNPRRSEFRKVAALRSDILAETPKAGDWTRLLGDTTDIVGLFTGAVGVATEVAKFRTGAEQLVQGSSLDKASKVADTSDKTTSGQMNALDLTDAGSGTRELYRSAREENPLRKQAASARRKKAIAGLGLGALGAGLGMAKIGTEGVLRNVPVLDIAITAVDVIKSGLELRESNQLSGVDNLAIRMSQARAEPNLALLNALGQDQGVQRTRMLRSGLELSLSLVELAGKVSPGVGQIIGASAGLAKTAVSMGFRIQQNVDAVVAQKTETTALGVDATEAEQLLTFRKHQHYAKIELALAAKRGDPEATLWFQARGIRPSDLMRHDSTLEDLVDIALSTAEEEADPTTVFDDIKRVGEKAGGLIERLKADYDQWPKKVEQDPTAYGERLNLDLQLVLHELATSSQGLWTLHHAVLEAGARKDLHPSDSKEARTAAGVREKAKTALEKEIARVRNNGALRGTTTKVENRWGGWLADVKKDVGTRSTSSNLMEADRQEVERAFVLSFETQVVVSVELVAAAVDRLEQTLTEVENVDSQVLSEEERVNLTVQTFWRLDGDEEKAIKSAFVKHATSTGGASAKNETELVKKVEAQLKAIRDAVGKNPAILRRNIETYLNKNGTALGTLEGNVDQIETLIQAGDFGPAQKIAGACGKLVGGLRPSNDTLTRDLSTFNKALTSALELGRFLEAEKTLSPALTAVLQVCRFQVAVLNQSIDGYKGLEAVRKAVGERMEYVESITSPKSSDKTFARWKDVTTTLGRGRALIREAYTYMQRGMEAYSLLDRAAEAGAAERERKEHLGVLLDLIGSMDRTIDQLKNIQGKLSGLTREMDPGSNNKYDKWTLEAMRSTPELSTRNGNDDLCADLDQLRVLYGLAQSEATRVEKDRPPALFENERKLTLFGQRVASLKRLIEQLRAIHKAENDRVPGSGARRRQVAAIRHFSDTLASEVARRGEMVKKISGPGLKNNLSELDRLKQILVDHDKDRKEILPLLDNYEPAFPEEPMPRFDNQSTRHFRSKSGFEANRTELKAIVDHAATLVRPAGNKTAPKVTLQEVDKLRAARALARAWCADIATDLADLRHANNTLLGKRFAPEREECKKLIAGLDQMAAFYLSHWQKLKKEIKRLAPAPA